ncbi:MAG: sodium:calcium antiporter [Rhodospirillales bacterium]
MLNPAAWPLSANIAVFIAATVLILFCGVAMTRVSATLAKITGFGEAFFGALFLGAVTSLSGSVTSTAAAAQGHPNLALANALGGIPAQTAFLVIADIFYRKANLEHSAASAANLVQGALLIALLSMPLAVMAMPPWTVWNVHPASLVIPAAYIGGLKLIQHAYTLPMWRPRKTNATQTEEKPPEGYSQGSPALLWCRFAACGVIVGTAGYALSESGVALSKGFGVSENLIGAVFTAVVTSLPELVTCLSAVRQGALNLAIGDILGGNSFDILFVAFSDIAYRTGSIYHVLGRQHVFLISITILMTAVLLLGLLRREKHGIGNIGFEGILVLALYALTLAVLIVQGSATNPP